MRATQRRPEPTVVQELIDAPYRFQFVQAVRLVLRLLRKHGIDFERAFAHVLHFQDTLSLQFPASEVAALRAGADVEACTDSMLRTELAQHGVTRIVITPAFIGLLGGSGGLPLHYTQQIASKAHEHMGEGARAFLNTFSNRMVGLFYQSCTKYRLEYTLDTQGEDRLLPMLNDLAGLTHRMEGREAYDVPADVTGYYAGLLGTRPVSARAAGRLLSDYFGVPIAVEQFVGCWDAIPEPMRFTLGGASAKLGKGATLGTRVWRHDVRARLRIGPLEEDQLERFLPSGDVAPALTAMLALLGVPGIEFEVELVLAPSCIKPLVLTSEPAKGRRLGWTAFLGSPPKVAATKTVRYQLPSG